MLQKIVMTGEGPTDMGTCNDSQAICTDSQLDDGPIARLMFKTILQYLPNWNIDNLEQENIASHLTLIDEKWLESTCKGKKHGLIRPSKAVTKGMTVHAQRAQVLAEYAQSNDHQMAAYFHDTDGTRSQLENMPDRQEKLTQAIKAGFRAAKFENQGLAIVPKPTSEAWLICGVKESPYQHCGLLETSLSGNDNSPNRAPKAVLGEILGNSKYTRSDLNDLVNQLDPEKIDMPSFNDLRHQIQTAIRAICGEVAS